jgi:sugar phosphate isomerase/epimerase
MTISKLYFSHMVAIWGPVRIVQAVGTSILQCASCIIAPLQLPISANFSRLAQPTREMFLEVLASDIQELADLLAPHSFRLAYENWCWATVSPMWSQVWSIMKRVDRPNIGLFLDTFQTCSEEYGDPTTASGLAEDKDMRDNMETRFSYSLLELTKTVPKEKI